MSKRKQPILASCQSHLPACIPHLLRQCLNHQQEWDVRDQKIAPFHRACHATQASGMYPLDTLPSPTLLSCAAFPALPGSSALTFQSRPSSAIVTVHSKQSHNLCKQKNACYQIWLKDGTMILNHDGWDFENQYASYKTLVRPTETK